MKVIDAFWEKRNLGVCCKEVTFDVGADIVLVDSIKDICKETDYIVAKVPTGRFDINESLTSQGFTFIECSINCYLQLKDAVLTPLQIRLNNALPYQEMNDSDIAQLFSEIKNGLFSTDRIILDSHFTKEQSANRYVNWITDELSKTSKIYKVTYKDDTIGFFTFKSVSDGIYYPFLAGLYPKYASSGLGFATLRKPIEEAIRREGKAISTYVSSNNLAVIKAHIQQGYTINNIQNVFVKHNNIK